MSSRYLLQRKAQKVELIKVVFRHKILLLSSKTLCPSPNSKFRFFVTRKIRRSGCVQNNLFMSTTQRADTSQPAWRESLFSVDRLRRIRSDRSTPTHSVETSSYPPT